MKAREGQVLVTCFPETVLRNEESGDITLGGKRFWLPKTIAKPRQLGFVVAVGEKVEGLSFGDYVELRASAGDRGIFFNVPVRDLCGSYEGAITYTDMVGLRRVESEFSDKLYIGHPDAILYRINTLEDMGKKEPEITPLFDRLLIRHAPRHDMSTGGLSLVADYYRNPNPLARVIKIGNQVTQCEEDDVVLCELNCGTILKINGIEHSLIHEDDIHMNFGPELLTGIHYVNEGFAQVL